MFWASCLISDLSCTILFLSLQSRDAFLLMEFESNHLSWMKLVSSTYCWGIQFSNQNVWSILCACQKNLKILASWVLANVSRRSVLKTFRFYPVLQMLLHTVKSCDKYFSVNIKYLKNKRLAVLSLVIHWLNATSIFIIMYRSQSRRNPYLVVL